MTTKYQNKISINKKKEDSSLKQSKIIASFENTKGSISRTSLLEVAKYLNIVFSHDVEFVNNSKMQQNSGKNIISKIVKINKLFEDNNLLGNIKRAKNLALDLFTNNTNGYIIINNKDTNTNYELGKSGIKKTFSRNVPYKKTNTANILKIIGEEGIYLFTTKNIGDNEIYYHHFLTPVKAYNEERNAFIRSVIKEYINRDDLANKFYYHQFEYLDSKKEASQPAVLQSNKNQERERTSFSSKNISQHKDNVKLPLHNAQNKKKEGKYEQ